MLEKTLYSNGKNKYKDDTFSAEDWSAPTMVSPGEIRKRIASFKLEGRKVEDLRIIGLNYLLTRDAIESRAYHCLEQYENGERQKRSEYRNIDPATSYVRCAEIDEPFLIEFEDGDVFEIETPQEPEFRMSMNCIPWDITAGTNKPNIYANDLFAPCIGKTIMNVEVRCYYTDKDPMWHDFFDEEHSKRELVSHIILWLDDGNGISIGGKDDYCEIAYIDEQRRPHTISFEEIKQGLFNWEDLHVDEITGFVPKSPSFYFGEICLDHIELPYITLHSKNGKSALYISYDEDFLLFDWSITCLNRESFDEYSYYELSFQQWKKVLEIAERIVSFASFDDLFDYLIGFGITYINSHGVEKNIFTGRLNRNGMEIWYNRKKYLTQLSDMKVWSELVLSENEPMIVAGY